MLPTPDFVPAEWEALRSAVSAACGPTVIVGGALRDLDNGRPIKDLDLFVLVPPIVVDTFDPDFYEAALRRHVEGLEVVQQLHAGYCEFRDEVFHVTTCTVPGFEMEIQVIFAALETPLQAIERVDFGLCQIGWDGETLIKTHAYREDQRCARFTLLIAPDARNRKRSADRHLRFSQKYIGWPMVDGTPQARLL